MPVLAASRLSFSRDTCGRDISPRILQTTEFSPRLCLPPGRHHMLSPGQKGGSVMAIWLSSSDRSSEWPFCPGLWVNGRRPARHTGRDDPDSQTLSQPRTPQLQQSEEPTADHLSKELLWGVTKERDAAHQKLVQNDPHGPPIHRLAIALDQDHLWGDVLRSTTHLQR